MKIETYKRAEFLQKKITEFQKKLSNIDGMESKIKDLSNSVVYIFKDDANLLLSDIISNSDLRNRIINKRKLIQTDLEIFKKEFENLK